MALADSFDPARLFGCEVLDSAGHRLGRVTALVHRRGGCDVLLERRHWLRHEVRRADIDDLVEAGGHRFLLVTSPIRSIHPRDGIPA